jgi:hypothetical protein
MKSSIVMMVEQQKNVSAVLLARRAVAFPIYMLSLICEVAAYTLACIGAWVAGDDYPVS